MRALKQVFKRKKLPLNGMSVHFCGSLTAAQLASCQTVVIQHRMARCADRMKAVYFVTSNPCSPQEDETKLVAGLCGGMLATPEWLCSEGRQGLAVKSTPAVAVARRLWISDRFRLEQPRIAGIVDQALDTPDSRWKACGRDMWITKAIQPPPPLNVIALLTTPEKERVGVRTAFDLTSFLQFVFKLTQVGSFMGTA